MYLRSFGQRPTVPDLNLRLVESAGLGRLTVQNYLTPADNRSPETPALSINSSL
jgi:hypothetical protein